MTNLESANGALIDRFYQKKKQVEKKPVTLYLESDVMDAFNEFGKAEGKGARSELVNDLLKLAFGKQLEESKTAEQMITLIKNMENGERNKFLEYLFHEVLTVYSKK